jgi:hypothetical protein
VRSLDVLALSSIHVSPFSRGGRLDLALLHGRVFLAVLGISGSMFGVLLFFSVLASEGVWSRSVGHVKQPARSQAGTSFRGDISTQNGGSHMENSPVRDINLHFLERG